MFFWAIYFIKTAIFGSKAYLYRVGTKLWKDSMICNLSYHYFENLMISFQENLGTERINAMDSEIKIEGQFLLRFWNFLVLVLVLTFASIRID